MGARKEDIDKALMPIVAAILEKNNKKTNEGAARWARRTLSRLPQQAQNTNSAKILDIAAASMQGNQFILGKYSPEDIYFVDGLIPQKMERAQVGVRLIGTHPKTKWEFSYPPIDKKNIMIFLKTNPVIITIAYPEKSAHKTETKQIFLPLNSHITIPNSGIEIIIRTGIGLSYILRPSALSTGVRLQDIRDFVVQIRNATTDAIVGTGFATKGGIVTCAHVVRDAGVDPFSMKGRDVGVYYPEWKGRSSIKKMARVAAGFDQYNDDVVLLHLVDDSSPLGPETVAKLGSAKGSELHEFRSFGYRRLQNYQGLPAYGKIIGHIDKAIDGKLQHELLMLSTQNIDEGMSGAPVLDVERNLVVGVICSTWDSNHGILDRDTGFAVDAEVLSLKPIGLELQGKDLPRSSAPLPKIDIQNAREAVSIRQEVIWNNAPPRLIEWTGRDQLLKEITLDWIDPHVRITGLIGFGGEGKTSLVREWVDELLADNLRPLPDGTFWWSFYEMRNVEEFFDAVLNYLSGGRIDVRKVTSANSKAAIIGAMLGAGRYLFVLDGLEVLQYQDGDMYGSIRSPDLKAFLEFFASPDHSSFCLVTSRAPLLDMIHFSTYKNRDVDRLNPREGLDLLRKFGIRGSDEELDRVVREWDGHALTLSLLASYLNDHHEGNITQLQNIHPPIATEPRYERVIRVLRRYDEHLSEAAKVFLKLFSIFRRPVDRDAFDKVFRVKREDLALNAPIAALDDLEFQTMIENLVAYRILRYEAKTDQYTSHPIITFHYSALLAKDKRVMVETAHKQIKDYYLGKARNLGERPTLEDLIPLIEAVHHACQCGAYDEACGICWVRINRRREYYIINKLGAWEAWLEIMKEFFPGGDTSQDPLVSARYKSWILNDMGYCLINIGIGHLAEGFFERALNIALGSGDWANASRGYMNRSELYSIRGDLINSLEAASESLKLARLAKETDYECSSLAYQAWAYHLQGDLETAGQKFKEAEALQKRKDASKLYLYSLVSIHHADHLRRRGEVDYARRVTEANLEICERNHLPNGISMCHRVLGDLFIEAEQEEKASENYRQALDIARSISNRLVLIEALLSRGRWYASIIKDPYAALSDLTEALEYAQTGSYRLYVADIRIGLAWAHLVANNVDLARSEAGYALQMSQDMGYHWGIVDAKEVLAKMDER